MTMRARIIGVVMLVVAFVGVWYLAMSRPAPKALVVNDSWQTGVAEGDGPFRYPPSLGLTYVTPQEWPPKIAVTRGLLSCSPTLPEESPMAQTQWRTIGAHTYCVTVVRAGAAGSVYETYTYVTTRDDDIVTLVFTVQLPQCVNYDDPERVACVADQKRFDPDALVASIVRTIAR